MGSREEFPVVDDGSVTPNCNCERGTGGNWSFFRNPKVGVMSLDQVLPGFDAGSAKLGLVMLMIVSDIVLLKSELRWRAKLLVR